MDEAAAHNHAPSVLTEIPRYGAELAPASSPGGGAMRAILPEGIPRLNLALFALTLLTTTMAGAYMAGLDLSARHPIASVLGITTGLSFSLPLMAILLAHEMGHYLTARRNDVNTSLPYFIPAPWPSVFFIGTFGAFIRMRQMPQTRRVMFDIGAAGPWAGMLIALPCVLIGLHLSDIQPLTQGSGGGLELGNSLLFYGLSRWMLGVDPNLVNVNLHPLAFAGWLGFLVTTLNLLPVGQFDGGHVLYALTPRNHRKISTLFVLGCVLMVVIPLAIGRSFWGGWLLWAVIAVALGLGHPSTVDRDTPLSPARRVAAWLTVALFIVTFMPTPITLGTPDETPPQPQQSQSYDVMHHPPAPAAPHRAAVRI
ncbi:MAG TPA: site-2 protease family protein [Candidatus Binataceae bacterium]|nr:site-2 protease family protein [Candidatus Binataceae bacterium]